MEIRQTRRCQEGAESDGRALVEGRPGSRAAKERESAKREEENPPGGLTRQRAVFCHLLVDPPLLHPLQPAQQERERRRRHGRHRHPDRGRPRRGGEERGDRARPRAFSSRIFLPAPLNSLSPKALETASTPTMRPSSTHPPADSMRFSSRRATSPVPGAGKKGGGEAGGGERGEPRARRRVLSPTPLDGKKTSRPSLPIPSHAP